MARMGPPNEWASSDEPLTRKQYWWLYYNHPVAWQSVELKYSNGLQVTKAEVFYLIAKVRKGQVVTAAYLSKLGRKEPCTPPGHPTKWRSCNSPMTLRQKTWIEDVGRELGVAPATLEQKMASLTRGQAHQVIITLKVAKAQHYCGCNAAWLEAVIAQAMKEVPLARAVEDEAGAAEVTAAMVEVNSES
ncbi:hypothetical protein C8Q76DRAFT_831053 [Earliella scabrosa]|nr:hypothetical protein C8Q76DRAFT_831053 [Earliella scabrosa]